MIIGVTPTAPGFHIMNVPTSAYLLSYVVAGAFIFMLVWHRRTVLIGTSSNNAFKYESNRDYAEMRSIRDQIWRNRDALAAAGD
jgi:hypothetical protein